MNMVRTKDIKKMKNSLIAASLMILMAGCNNSNSTSKLSEGDAISQEVSASVNAEDAPVFEFAQSTYDFGIIKSGDKVSYDFKFKNVGKTPIIISDAQASCGCTVPEKPDHPIAPGEEGVIKVVFNSEGKFGKQDKVVTITSNAKPSITELHIVGEIEENK